MLLLESINKSIVAEVVINTSMFKLKDAKTRPLIAPPVPTNPAINPDKVPPTIELKAVAFIVKFLNNKNIALMTIKKKARKSSSVFTGKNLLKKAPVTTVSIAGMPMFIISLRLNPFLNKTILDTLLQI